MDNKNLPIKSNHALSKPAMSGSLVVIGFLGSIFTSYDLLFIILGVIGALLFIAGNLVNKSLESTQAGLSHPDGLQLSLKKVQHQIAQTKYMKTVDKMGEQAHRQSMVLEERWNFLKKTLEQKFKPTELTYERYMSAVSETVHLVLQNLTLLGSTLASMEIMLTSSEEFLTQKKLCDELMAFNESALKRLGELSHELTLINAGGSTDSSLEENLIEIKRLAHQAKKYSK